MSKDRVQMKDFLMVNAALKLIESGEFESLLYIRNNIEVKDTMPLGLKSGPFTE